MSHKTNIWLGWDKTHNERYMCSIILSLRFKEVSLKFEDSLLGVRLSKICLYERSENSEEKCHPLSALYLKEIL